MTLAGPIFDHSKVAIIDEMTRLGLPPGNPFFGEAGHDLPLAYYYLWHFSAAELALLPGVSGWEADIALSAFTAFSSVALMMGFAAWIGGRAAAGILGGAARLCRLAASGRRGDFRRGEFLFLRPAADRLCRLAVPDHLGAAAHGVGVLRAAVERSAAATGAAAVALRRSFCSRSPRLPATKARPGSAASCLRSPRR